MAAGLPPILSRGNDLGWEFAEGGFSWQMHTDEPLEVGAAIEAFNLLTDLQLRERGDAARRWTEQHLSIDRFRRELESIVHEAGAKKKDHGANHGNHTH
jgi:glycosyltransferase involved in cell wall biosynthesis